MNLFLSATKRALDRNGSDATFISVTEGAYNVETGSATNTEKSYTVKMYKKPIKANQYNYPNLIGKDAGMFYLANYNLKFTPGLRDKIVFAGSTYSVESIQEHYAGAELILYRIIAVKG